MTSASLYLDDVTISYTAEPVIRHISLEAKKGEIFGLMGLNGAGKTTMIKAILGLRQQDSGLILINDTQNDDLVSKKALSYLPEKFEPPWFLTGMEFLKFSHDLYKRPFEEEKMYEAAEKLALDKAALKRRVHTYSKGMRQKLGLMGTLLTGCDLFILDEPMSGLDPRARARVKAMIQDIKTHNSTIFLSSHILADMDEICDRVALLHDGEIQYIGTPEQLKKDTHAQGLEQAFLDYIEKDKAA